MRADRLLSMLMLLQSRGRMTAEQLAAALEVSERTIYRDINALSFAGVPVYAERGRGGGISLVDRYRSDLTGLNQNEVRALFMLAIPAALTDLGLDRELQAAMRKLAAALPATFQKDEQMVRQRLHFDPHPWVSDHQSLPGEFLQTVQHALWNDQMLAIRYQSWQRTDIAPMNSVVAPYGLVAKAGNWHLVAKRDDYLVVLNLNQFVDAQLQQESFVYPPDFDLQSFWADWCVAAASSRAAYPVLARFAPALLDPLPAVFRERLEKSSANSIQIESDGWATLNLYFDHFSQARDAIIQFGGAVEVLAPLALRLTIADYAQQIVNRYRPQG